MGLLYGLWRGARLYGPGSSRRWRVSATEIPQRLKKRKLQAVFWGQSLQEAGDAIVVGLASLLSVQELSGCCGVA